MTTRSRMWRRWLTIVIGLVLMVGIASCSSDRADDAAAPSRRSRSVAARSVVEVPPPALIQELNQFLETHQPQVQILNPQPDQILTTPEVTVRLQVRDLPLYQEANTELGSHLSLILDNQPGRAIYDTSTPITLTDLAPGTHTLRVFAARPWHESYKNDGAYAQVTFHILTKTPNHNPDLSQPLLTYSQPQGTYGAEPILLDFYVQNAPLHVIARADATDDIGDWQIRCTVNGQSFVFDTWQPIYLKGFQPGQNWVKLEFLDETGQAVPNAFNTTVRLIDYQPGGHDALSPLVRGELTATAARRIIDPNYEPPAPAPAPTPEPAPAATPAPTLEVRPETPNQPTPDSTSPDIDLPAADLEEEFPTPEPDRPASDADAPAAIETPEPGADQAEPTGDRPDSHDVEAEDSSLDAVSSPDQPSLEMNPDVNSPVPERIPTPGIEPESIAPSNGSAAGSDTAEPAAESMDVEATPSPGPATSDRADLAPEPLPIDEAIDELVAPATLASPESPSEVSVPDDRPSPLQKVRGRLSSVLERLRQSRSPATPDPNVDNSPPVPDQSPPPEVIPTTSEFDNLEQLNTAIEDLLN